MPPELLQEAKDKLRITWNEEDSKVTRLVEAAISEIDKRTGKKNDYVQAGFPKTMMLEHVFYNWNNALSEFYRVYSSELTGWSITVAAEEIANDD
jgi:hypothetical protein